MKKRIRFISALFAAVLLLGGCAIHEKEIRAASDGFLAAVKEGDREKALEYAAPQAVEKAGLNYSDKEELENSLYEQMFSQDPGIGREDLSEETQAAFSEFVDTLIQRSVLGYEILEIREKKGVGTVTGTVVAGYSEEQGELLREKGDIEKVIQVYREEHTDELLEVYQQQGPQAMKRKIYSDVIMIMAYSMKESIEEAEEVVNDAVLTVEKQDGRWIVTDIILTPVTEEAGNADPN